MMGGGGGGTGNKSCFRYELAASFFVNIMKGVSHRGL